MTRLHLVRSADPAERSPESPVRVVLADDHAIVRRSLRHLLDRAPDIEVAAEVSDLVGAANAVRSQRPDALILAVGLPDGSTFQTIRELRASAPETGIVAVTMKESPALAQRAIEAGALGFVLKDRADSELLPAIRSASQGDEYISPSVAVVLAALQRADGQDGLTRRETEILRLIALGHTTSEIADMIHLSRRTIDTDRARIHQCLGLQTRAELVRFALTRHLIG